MPSNVVYLRALLAGLPSTLPYSSATQSAYKFQEFSLNDNDIQDLGLAGVTSRSARETPQLRTRPHGMHRRRGLFDQAFHPSFAGELGDQWAPALARDKDVNHALILQIYPSEYMSTGHTSDCVYDVPMALDSHLLRTRGLEPDDASLRMRGHLHETANYVVGPMPVQNFIDDFTPPPPLSLAKRKRILSSRAAFTGVPSSCATAAEIFEPMIAALNRSTKHKSRASGLMFENVSARSEHPHALGFMKPHICCYTPKGAESVHQSPISSRAALGYAELFIEVKPDVSLDYFVDPPLAADAEHSASHDFLAKHEDKRTRLRVDRSFGQHIAYVTEIFARQQRVCLYSVSMAGSFARLCRWDRSGLIITRSFEFRVHLELLCEFLARFAYGSSSARGHDTTVNKASSKEEETFRDAITKCVQQQLCVDGDELAKAIREHYSPGPRGGL
ncbi:hypothetical protein NUW54_g9745 [Trametes sanguinea]|uniref:Uncharacterized protein n=1 Tax=Trametes sanguinea TaxID=158606 RepID=A0ACC1P3Y3_9APHY|nr:hypothetical protein NUW54_g9745 [Trametes sanguinea]